MNKLCNIKSVDGTDGFNLREVCTGKSFKIFDINYFILM